MNIASDMLEVISKLPFNLVMAEIGCFKGHSTISWILSGKVNKIYCVDPWCFDEISISSDNYTHTIDGVNSIELQFDEIMSDVDSSKYVKIKNFSKEASNLFSKYQLDFVHIDGNHSYESVKTDILCWKDKIKIGGIIGGHDYSSGWPGLVNAVDELLGKPDFISNTHWIKYL